MKFVRDKAHCKFESYTKEEINIMLDKKAEATNVYEKGNYAKTEVEISVESNYQSINNISLSYPEGFNKDNAYVLNARYFDGTMYVTQHLTPLSDSLYQDTLSYSLRDAGIVLTGRLPYFEVGTKVKIQLLLMKVE